MQRGGAAEIVLKMTSKKWYSMLHEPEPVIPLETLRQALGDDRLVFHMQPIITLPQRRTHGYDIVPRLIWRIATLLIRPTSCP